MIKQCIGTRVWQGTATPAVLLFVALLFACPAMADIAYDNGYIPVDPLERAWGTYLVITYPDSSQILWQGLTKPESPVDYDWTLDFDLRSIPPGSRINNLSVQLSTPGYETQTLTIESTPVDPSGPSVPATVYNFEMLWSDGPHWWPEFTGFSIGDVDIPLHNLDGFNLMDLGVAPFFVSEDLKTSLSGHTSLEHTSFCCFVSNPGYNSDTAVSFLTREWPGSPLVELYVDYTPTPEPSSFLLLIVPIAVFLVHRRWRSAAAEK